MSTYTGADIIDLDVTTPTEDSTPPSEVNDAIREIKTVYKNQNATIVKSTNYTLTSADSFVLVSGNTTITVPESSGVSSSTFLKQYTIIKTDSSATTVTIARSGSDTFNGATSQTLKIQYSGVILLGSGVVDWKAVFTSPITFGNDTTKFLRDDGTMAVASSSATVTSISGTVSITSGQCNGLTKLYTTDATTATMPAATAGLMTSIEIGHAGGLTINRAGSDTFTLGGVTGLTSIGADIVVGGLYELTCYVAGVWQVKRRGVQPSFKASKASSNQTSLSTGQWYKCQFDDDVGDNNADFDDVTNYRHTPKIPGTYIYTLVVSGSMTAAGNLDITVRKNDTATKIPRGWIDASGEDGLASYTTTLAMNGSDYAEGFMQFSGGTGTMYYLYSHLECVRISD